MSNDGVGAFIGAHCLTELADVSASVLDDEPLLRDTIVNALRESGATVCEVTSKRFTPHGVTVLALLAESHASIHTYPEHGSAFVDVFTCGGMVNPEQVARLLAQKLRACVSGLTVIPRGVNARMPPVSER